MKLRFTSSRLVKKVTVSMVLPISYCYAGLLQRYFAHLTVAWQLWDLSRQWYFGQRRALSWATSSRKENFYRLQFFKGKIRKALKKSIITFSATSSWKRNRAVVVAEGSDFSDTKIVCTRTGALRKCTVISLYYNKILQELLYYPSLQHT